MAGERSKNNSVGVETVYGTIFGIQHFSIHDGPGIRTTVFLKGCPLSCIWCHNPEGISIKRQLSFSQSKCINCGMCFKICPDIHSMEDNKHLIDRTKCRLCGSCVKGCYGKALEIIGWKATSEEVIQTVLKDKRYYEASNGGVTFSGGEPMLQPEFLHSMLVKAKEHGIHTVVETSGFIDTGHLKKIAPMVDLFLFDYKESNPQRHKEYTGAENDLILGNLKMLYDAGAGIILRCPVIPGLNDRNDHFAAIAALTVRFPGLYGAEIMAYHRLGTAKNARIGVSSQNIYEQPDEKTINSWKNMIRQNGGRLYE